MLKLPTSGGFLQMYLRAICFAKHQHTCAFICAKCAMVNRHTYTRRLLTSHPPFKQPQRDLRDSEGSRKQTQEISYTHRSPLHLPAPISPHFCLLSFLSYELSLFLPFLLSPLISYCATLWNVHRPRISMECHCSVCWKALCPLSSSPSDMTKGRKGRHGRVIKSLSMKETQKDEERKGENPETIFESDSPTVHTTKERYGLSDLVKGKAVFTKIMCFGRVWYINVWETDSKSSCIFYRFSHFRHILIEVSDNSKALTSLVCKWRASTKGLDDKSRQKKNQQCAFHTPNHPNRPIRVFLQPQWQPRGPIAKSNGERDSEWQSPAGTPRTHHIKTNFMLVKMDG